MAERLIVSVEGDDKKNLNLYESSVSSPELFVDGIQGMMVVGAVAKLNFFTRDWPSANGTQNEGERRKLACRMVMTVDTLLSVADYLHKHAQEIKTQIGQQQAQPTALS
jgi:hypothetical protein